LCLRKHYGHQNGIQDHGRPALLYQHIQKLIVSGGLLQVAAYIGAEGSNCVRFVIIVK
jgi:hypothetical protein